MQNCQSVPNTYTGYASSSGCVTNPSACTPNTNCVPNSNCVPNTSCVPSACAPNVNCVPNTSCVPSVCAPNVNCVSNGYVPCEHLEVVPVNTLDYRPCHSVLDVVTPVNHVRHEQHWAPNHTPYTQPYRSSRLNFLKKDKRYYYRDPNGHKYSYDQTPNGVFHNYNNVPF